MKDLKLRNKNYHDTSDLLEQTYISLVEGITGVAASDRKDLVLSIGHIFQRIRSQRFLQVLHEEWDSYRQKGRIKDDYIHSEQHQECLQEMLDFLDRDSPDEITFSFLKKLFLTAATENASDRDSVLPQQYMKVCRTLSSGEILVLSAAFDETKRRPLATGDVKLIQWRKTIAERYGLKYPELVETHEAKLVEKNCLPIDIHIDQRL